jgi:hypothetical protein
MANAYSLIYVSSLSVNKAAIGVAAKFTRSSSMLRMLAAIVQEPTRMLKATLLAFLLWAMTLLSAVATVALGEFGAPLWITVLLLLWLVTLGAPTTAAVLAIIWWWPGGSFLAFVGLAVAVALAAQIGVVWSTVEFLRRSGAKSQS